MSDQNARANSRTRSNPMIRAAAVAAALSLYGTAQAADRIKANNADDLNLTTAWVGGSVPAAIDVAVWNNTVAAANAVSLGADTSWAGIRIENPGGAVTINNNSLTLGALGIDASTATQNLTIGSGLQLLTNVNQRWVVASGRTIDVTNAVTRQANATVDLDISSGGIIHLGGLPAAAINYASINGGRDFAGLDLSGNVVALSGVTAYVANPNTGGGNPNIENQTAPLDVINSNSNGIATGFRLASSPRTLAGGLRFNTPLAQALVDTGRIWNADVPGGRTLNIGGAGLLVGPDVNVPVSLTGTGFVNGNGPDGFMVRNYSSFDVTIFPQVTGTNPFVKVGPGRVVLAHSSNNNSGGTVIQEGTLRVGNGGAGSLGAGAVVNRGTLDFNRTAAITVANDISGPGQVSISQGDVTLSGNNSYTGVTALRGGLLNLTDINDVGATSALSFDGGGIRYGAGIVNDVSNISTVGSSGATVNTNGNDVTFASALGGGGAGALTKAGAGVLTLTAANAHTGAINVNGGTLRLTGSGGNGGITVNTGGTLAGAGASNGQVTVNTGGRIAPGNSIGTFTTPSLSLQSGSILDFEFSASTSDRIVVSGSDGLTINGGAFNVFAENTTSAFTLEGTYNVLQFAGNIQGGVGNLSVANPVVGFDYDFNTSGNFVTLTIDQVAVSSRWITDTSGNWSDTTKWEGGIVPTNVGSIALFNTALSQARTVTLDGSRTVGGIVFDSANGYTIATGSGTLNAETPGALGNAQFVVNAGSHSIAAPLNLVSTLDANLTTTGATLVVGGTVSGGGSLNKNGPGVLVLSGGNTYSGSTTINAGTVEIGSNSALSGSQVTFTANSALRSGAAGLSLSNTLNIANASTVTVDTQGNTMTLSGDINESNGNGALRKAGSGTLILTGSANHNGGTTIAEGTLQIGTGGTSGQLSQSGGSITNNGAILHDRSDDRDLHNIISGTGSVHKRGAANLTMGGANTYTGGTVVSDGRIRASTNNWPGVGAVTPFGTGSIQLQTTTTGLDLADVPITSGPVVGSGTVDASGIIVHTMNVTADASFDGRFDAGQLSITKTGGSAYTLTSNAGLGVHNIAGVTSSGGTFALNGATAEMNMATVSLSNGGAFRVDNGSVNLTGGVTIQNAGENCRFIVAGGIVNMAGGININRSAAANNDPTTGLQVSGGSLTVAGNVTISNNNSWGAFAISGGSVSFTSTAANALIINNQAPSANRGGFFRITGGTFSAAASNGMIINNQDRVGIAEFQGGHTTLEGILVFSPAAAVDGISTLNMSGGEVYLGALGISSGFTGNNGAGSLVNNVILSGGTLGATANWASSLNMRLDQPILGPAFSLKAANSAGAPFGITLSGALSGAGGVNKVGAGVATLSGTNNYTGTTTVTAGRLVLAGTGAHAAVFNASGTATGIEAGADVKGGRLVFDYTGGSTVGAQVLGILDAGYDQTTRFSAGQIRTSNPSSTATGLGWIDKPLDSQVTVAFTYFGDADLDGDVDVTDLGFLAGNWQAAGVWGAGDFDYNGTINVTDLGLLAGNWQAGVGNPLGPDFATAAAGLGLPAAAVPEPASMGIITALAGLSLRRRNRSR